MVENATQGYKKSSIRMMAKGMPHQFEPAKVKFTTLCVSCANQIYFGQKAKKCRDCQCTVHANCDLMENCGMPVDLMRQALHENGSDNSFSTNSLTDSEPSVPDFSLEGIEPNKLEMQLNELLNSNEMSPKKGKHDQNEFTFSSGSIMDILK